MTVEIGNVSSTITAVVLLVLIGFLARKFKLIDDSFSKKLSALVVYIGSPALMISGLINTEYSANKLLSGFFVFFLGFAVYVLIYLFSYLITPFFKEQNEKNIVTFALEFSNAGFVGFPILGAMFGAEGRFLGAFYVAFFNIITWMHGISIILRKNGHSKISLFKVFVNFGTVPGVIGILLFVFRISLPVPLMTAIEYTAGISTPISMFVIGGLIATIPLGKLFSSIKVYMFSFVRLIVVPLIVALVCHLCNIDDKYVLIISALTSLPAAANTVMFAEQYDVEPKFAAHCIGMSTVLSVLTIPTVIYIVQLILKI